MASRKIRIISFLILIILTFSLFYSSSLIKLFRFGITGLFTSVKEETDLISAVNKLIEGEDEFIVNIQENKTCYWIKSTTDENHYILQINEYESSINCVGFVKDRVTIRLNQWLNVFGDTSCLCKGEYLLKMEAGGLSIKKR